MTPADPQKRKARRREVPGKAVAKPAPLLPTPRALPRIGAFFDMDKTLIAENSGATYVKVRYERGEIDEWEVARGVATYLQYKVGLLDIAAWTRSMVTDVKGRRESELAAEGRMLFDERVRKTIYPQAAEIVKQHLADGHVVAIISGATRFIVEPLAEHLGVEHCLYTRLEAEGGVLTGRIVEPACFDEGKIYWLQQLLEDERIDLARSYFYTDSVTDLPLLDIVGYPVVTNPDPVLYRTARKRGWPVRLFEAPSEA